MIKSIFIQQISLVYQSLKYELAQTLITTSFAERIN